jgi:monoamine oxidase
MMQRISRRTLLAAAASTVAAPSLGLAQGAGDLDVIVIGAGAAGIAAARRVNAAGRRCVVIEASDVIGGRCATDMRSFGTPFERGARALYMSDVSALAKLARGAGLDVYAAPLAQRLRIGARFAREGEMESYLAMLVRARLAVDQAAGAERDMPASRVLTKELGDWRPTAEFMLGPYVAGKNLEEISVQDLAASAPRDAPAYCRQGLGPMLAKLAEGIGVRLSTPAVRVATWRGVSYVETSKGTLQARAVIVTVSTGVLAAGKIRFDPVLPKTHTEAFAKLSLGTHERVALELAGNPLGLGRDESVFEKAAGPRTAALMANVGGSAICTVDVAGKFGAGLAAQGDAALTAFATDWLAGLFGGDVRKAVRRTQVTRWGKEPWVMGAIAVAPPGAQELRETLAEPVRERVFFAGEATHQTMWGTVNGAWDAGEQAAEAVLKQIGGARRAAPKKQRQRKPPPRPQQAPMRDVQ